MLLFKEKLKEIGTIIILVPMAWIRRELLKTRKRIVLDIHLSVYVVIMLTIYFILSFLIFICVLVCTVTLIYMYTHPLQIDINSLGSDVNNTAYLLPVITRSVRRGMILSTIKNRLGPINKTLANKFNIISLIGLLSYETLYSLIFIVIFYLSILILGGLVVYFSQEDLTKLSLIGSLLPIMEIKDNILEPLSQFIMDKTNGNNVPGYLDTIYYYYDSYIKYYVYLNTISFIGHIIHDMDQLYFTLLAVIRGTLPLDPLLTYPVNHLVHYFAYIGVILKYYWFNPITEFMVSVYSIPSKGLVNILNTTLITELLWLYNYMDDMLVITLGQKLFTIKTITDDRMCEYIINKDWSNDFFVKLIKHRLLLCYYFLTGQNDKYQGILDIMLADSVSYHETIFGNNVEVFNAETTSSNTPDGEGEGEEGNDNTDNQNEGNEPVNIPDTVTDVGVHWSDINKFKYMFIDSPALRTSIALSACLIVKYSTRVLLSNIIS